ncbi:hypothetical protein [Streptomyces sp. TN58]|uniref:hypothetical protein n=1 Tax=Streptomyces sp. TN58 TaxID=234612 RepID=UPI0013314225|nr:hypothetical protein [Streptomyces sp. TN58]
MDERAAADDFAPENIELPTVPPPGSATTVALRVLTLSRPCWACGKDTVCLIGLYPQRPARGYVGLFTTDNAKTMALVRRLLQQHGHAALAATVKSRYSRTMRERQLSNGCGHCDTLQGNFPVHDEAMGRVAASGGRAGHVVGRCLPGAGVAGHRPRQQRRRDGDLSSHAARTPWSAPLSFPISQKKSARCLFCGHIHSLDT